MKIVRREILITVLAILLGCSVVLAQPLRNLVFEWEQVISEDFGGWYLYMAQAEPDGYIGEYQRVLDIPYTNQTGPIYSNDFVAEGTLGEVKQLYFVLSAYDNDGNESGFSNAAQARIDFESPSAPFQLVIKIQKVE